MHAVGLLAQMALWTASAYAALSTPLMVDRLDSGEAATPAAEVVAGTFNAQFVAQPYAAITPSHDHEIWYRLHLMHDWTSTRPPLLNIIDPQGLHIDVYAPPTYAKKTFSIYGKESETGFSRHTLAVLLPNALKAAAPVYLHVAPGRALAHRIEIQDVMTAHATDLANVRLDVVFPAVQLASLLVMFAFFVALRERMYAYFVGHVLFLVLYEIYEFGIGYELAPFNLLASLEERPAWWMATMAAIFLCLFSRRFLDLAHTAPRIDRVLAGLGLPLALFGAGVILPVFSADGWTIDLLLITFLITASVLLIAGILSWQHGNRRGGLYLCAWLPGLLFVIVRALQLIAQWPQPDWLELALPASFAFASIVLAFGLAEHTLSIRYERDVAHRLAEHDMLTGVLNRRAIQATARAAFRNAREAGESLALLFLDIDHFKRINDSHGHRIGDRCLRAITVPIAAELRHDDALGRYGGEEFLVVLPRTTASEAELIAERIRSRVQDVPIFVSGTRIGLTFSIGIAMMNDDVRCVEDLIECADVALYRAKSGGRNRVHTHPRPGGEMTDVFES